LANEPRDDPHRIPEQGVVGRMMNVKCRAYCYAELSGEQSPDFASRLEV
jgi:hypothetical protein